MCFKDGYMSYNTYVMLLMRNNKKVDKVKWKMIFQTSKKHIIKSTGYILNERWTDKQEYFYV